MSSGPQKSDRQAFFAQFSQAVMKDLHRSPAAFSSIPLILLTGGLRSPFHLQTALASRHADLLGIGRGAVLCPDLPRILRLKTQNVTFPSLWDENPFVHEPEAVLRSSNWISSVKLVGGGVGTAWYTIRMRDVAVSQIENPGVDPPPVDYSRGGLISVFKLWAWFHFSRTSSRVLRIFLALVVAIGVLYYH
jgi:hypothetical protein